MGKKQDNGRRDANRTGARQDVPSPVGDAQINADLRNPKTLDRVHGTEVAVARVLWIATSAERES
jgi:hypothetical protein